MLVTVAVVQIGSSEVRLACGMYLSTRGAWAMAGAPAVHASAPLAAAPFRKLRRFICRRPGWPSRAPWVIPWGARGDGILRLAKQYARQHRVQGARLGASMSRGRAGVATGETLRPCAPAWRVRRSRPG